MTGLAAELAGLAYEDGPAVIELGGLAWMHELRNKRGEWARTPGDRPGKGIHRYVVPGHARLVDPSKRADYHDPADDPVWKGGRPDKANILKAYDVAKATPGAVEQGRAWYPQMHRLAKWIGQGDAEKGAILLSTYSPQVVWPVNMINAARAGERNHALGPGEAIMVTKAQQRKAQAALDGQGITELMKASKTHSFARLLARGGDDPSDPYGHVVIDRHALSVAVGHQLEPKANPADDALYRKVSGNSRYAEYVADEYRKAAAEISAREGRLMSPHELQAITWLVQKAHNEASGSGGEALSKGRATYSRNAWAAWMDHAKRHGIPVVPGVSAPGVPTDLAGLAAVLADLGWKEWLHPRGGHGEFAPTGMKSRYSHGGAFAVLHDTGPRRVFAERLVAGPGSAPGDATGVLRKMHADADRLGVTIEGEVHPLEGVHARHPMTSAQLRAWYAKFGYQPTGQPFRVARRPASLAAELARFDPREPGAAGRGGEARRRDPGSLAACLSLAYDPLERRDPRGRWAREGGKWVPVEDIPVAARTDLLTEAPRGGPASAEVARGVPVAEGLLGGKSAWTGRTYTWQDSDPAYKLVAGEMSWRGDMGLKEGVAWSVMQQQRAPGKPGTASPWEVLLHELIHSVIPAGQAYSDHQAAYQDKGGAAIEEGFTQLGTYHHAAEFFDRMGIGDRPTMTLATDEWGDPVPSPAFMRETGKLAADMQEQWAKMAVRDPEGGLAGALGEVIEDLKHNPIEAMRRLVTTPSGDVFYRLELQGDTQTRAWARKMKSRAFSIYRDVPSEKRQTFREQAEEYNDPASIGLVPGSGWGSYWQQTGAAQAWVDEVAAAEGHANLRKGTDGWRRTVELSDEVNREGARDKPLAMARQVLRSAAVQSPPLRPRPEYRQRVLEHLGRYITENWPPATRRDPGSYGDTVRRLESLTRLWPEWFEGTGPALQAAS